MNYRMVFRVQSWILLIESVLMLPALVISLVTQDKPAVIGFVDTMALLLVIGLLGLLATKNSDRRFFAPEGMLSTGLA